MIFWGEDQAGSLHRMTPHAEPAPCPSLITVVLLCENKQIDKENSLTILSNVQLFHSPTQLSFRPHQSTAMQPLHLAGSESILSCFSLPPSHSQSLGASPCPDYPIARHCSGFCLLSCLKRCSDPLHGCTTPVKRGGGELHLGVKMTRKSLRG